MHLHLSVMCCYSTIETMHENWTNWNYGILLVLPRLHELLRVIVNAYSTFYWNILTSSNLQNQFYTLKIKIAEVVSIDNWWYMGFKQCWKKLRKEQCLTCTQGKPFPRYFAQATVAVQRLQSLPSASYRTCGQSRSVASPAIKQCCASRSSWTVLCFGGKWCNTDWSACNTTMSRLCFAKERKSSAKGT